MMTIPQRFFEALSNHIAPLALFGSDYSDGLPNQRFIGARGLVSWPGGEPAGGVVEVRCEHIDLREVGRLIDPSGTQRWRLQVSGGTSPKAVPAAAVAELMNDYPSGAHEAVRVEARPSGGKTLEIHGLANEMIALARWIAQALKARAAGESHISAEPDATLLCPSCQRPWTISEGKLWTPKARWLSENEDRLCKCFGFMHK